jgi:hypothetical protein
MAATLKRGRELPAMPRSDAHLREENRVLREQIGGRRLRFTDDQRRRLAVKAELLAVVGSASSRG